MNFNFLKLIHTKPLTRVGSVVILISAMHSKKAKNKISENTSTLQ
jgi:hypothetical protein